MNYLNQYEKLMKFAMKRMHNMEPIEGPIEFHHIRPRSLGGRDTPDNLVMLTVKEHYVAHLLLYKAGVKDQIFAVQALLNDATNPKRSSRYRHPALRWKSWLRRAVAFQTAFNYRKQNTLQPQRRKSV